jgi:hypothetical protein
VSRTNCRAPPIESEMIKNRIKEYIEEPEEERGQGDFWVVYGPAGLFYVSAETAGTVARRLQRWWVPRWVTFVDLAGARVRLRSCDVRAVYESTELQRTRERSFFRAREQEEKADRRPWEEDE